MKHLKLDPTFKKLWVEALRSGKYLRGTGKLRTVSNDITDGGNLVKTERYCCLGVAHQVATGRKPPSGDSNAQLGPKLSNRLKLSHKTQGSLARKNDSDRWSFKRIANWIEENL